MTPDRRLLGRLLGEAKREPATTIAWMAGAFSASLALAVLVLLAFGAGPTGTHRALQATARLAFLPFWLAYAGGALATLFGSPFQAVARRGRELGLAFAAALLVHVGLVAWLYRISTDAPVSPGVFAFFAAGVAWTCLLVLLSFRRLAGALRPGRLRALRVVGMEYIGLAFLVDFVGHPLRGQASVMLAYLPFSILAVAGIVLRLAAWARRGLAVRPSGAGRSPC
ncbi:MAG: hypothetical protein ICV73_11430 [Acetobacteraceae bacterium]|nr:hypothetical protein [Acetobacteraceae bacterium]